MLFNKSLFLCLLSLYTALSTEFLTGVHMRIDETELYNATACELLQSKAQELWTDGSFRNCHSLTTVEVGHNLHYIIFHIVAAIDKLFGYSGNAQYFAKAALVNSLLNDARGSCSTITGNEWMNTTYKPGTIYTFKASYPGNTSIANCNTLLNIAHHSIEGQNLIACDSLATEKRTAYGSTVYFYITLKIVQTSPLLSLDLFRTLSSIARIINHNGKTCISVESVTTGYGWRRLSISINGAGNVTSQNICNWFVRMYARAIQTGPFYNCDFQAKLAYRNAILLSLDLKASLYGIPLELMNHAETALRTESLFNSDQDECISFDASVLYTVFQKGTYDESYEMYLSGPIEEDICAKMMEYYTTDYTEMFSKCYRQSTSILPQLPANYSLHILTSIKPVYLIDYTYYVDSHREMIYAFNDLENGCKYNGFVMET